MVYLRPRCTQEKSFKKYGSTHLHCRTHFCSQNQAYLKYLSNISSPTLSHSSSTLLPSTSVSLQLHPFHSRENRSQGAWTTCSYVKLLAMKLLDQLRSIWWRKEQKPYVQGEEQVGGENALLEMQGFWVLLISHCWDKCTHKMGLIGMHEINIPASYLFSLL